MSPTYGHVTKLLKNRNSNTKEINKLKIVNSQLNFVVFLPGTNSENTIIEILYRKGQKKNWTKFSSLGQEPTFNGKVQSRCDVAFCGILVFQVIEERLLLKTGDSLKH